MLNPEKKARYDEIAENYKRVTDQIAEAVVRRGGAPVTLLAATKTVPADEIEFAITELGLSFVGENRVQELVSKYDTLRLARGVHMIGSLQTNKVRQVVGKADMIESVDSRHLADEISRQSVRLGVVSDVLCELNSGREAAKGGVFPEETDDFVSYVEALPGIRVRGLMTMAPKCTEKCEYLKYFSETYQVFIDISAKKSHNVVEPVLSMGMSDSYLEAIASGATLVRVGSAIFGARYYPPKQI